MESRSDVYASAGVDITAGYRSVELMKEHIKRTMTKGVVSDVGGFGGLFELDLEGIKKPVLVSGTDGVGVHVELHCKCFGYCKRVDYIGLSAFSLLVRMHLVRVFCGHADFREIIFGVVLSDLFDKGRNQCFIHKEQ